MRQFFLAGALFFVTSLVISNLQARELVWPLSCAPGQHECERETGYPDIDGDNLSNTCELPTRRWNQGTDLRISADGYLKGVDVLAASDGVVVQVLDGNFDNCVAEPDHPHCNYEFGAPNPYLPGGNYGYTRCTELDENGDYSCFHGAGNIVVVEHSDSDELYGTRYEHLKNGIDVAVGDLISAGDKLGEVASAGQAREYELGFLAMGGPKVWEQVDPWPGPCAIPDVAESLWKHETPWLPAYKFPEAQWLQFSLPAMAMSFYLADEFNIGSIFDELYPYQYAVDWVMFEYSAEENNYFVVDEYEELQSGKAYWILQFAGKDFEIEMPASDYVSGLRYHPLCKAPDNMCFNHVITASTEEIQWEMIGNPFLQDLDLANIQVVASNTDCDSGCSIDEAADAEVINNKLYALLDGSDYTELDSSDDLGRWQGAWIGMYPAVDSTAAEITLLMAP